MLKFCSELTLAVSTVCPLRYLQVWLGTYCEHVWGGKNVKTRQNEQANSQPQKISRCPEIVSLKTEHPYLIKGVGLAENAALATVHMHD